MRAISLSCLYCHARVTGGGTVQYCSAPHVRLRKRTTPRYTVNQVNYFSFLPKVHRQCSITLLECQRFLILFARTSYAMSSTLLALMTCWTPLNAPLMSGMCELTIPFLSGLTFSPIHASRTKRVLRSAESLMSPKATASSLNSFLWMSCWGVGVGGVELGLK